MQDILLQNPVLSGANKKSGLSGKTSADRNKSILYHAKNRLKKKQIFANCRPNSIFDDCFNVAFFIIVYFVTNKNESDKITGVEILLRRNKNGKRT
jgi:hypothetical protein